MTLAIIDTDILIALNGGRVDRSFFKDRFGFDDFGISRISYCEYLVGFKDPLDRVKASNLLSISYKILEINQDIANRAVDLRVRHRLKLPDALIYATARSLGVPFLTYNKKDFDEDIPGVHIPYVIEE